jgi:hypothetical protein
MAHTYPIPDTHQVIRACLTANLPSYWITPGSTGQILGLVYAGLPLDPAIQEVYKTSHR